MRFIRKNITLARILFLVGTLFVIVPISVLGYSRIMGTDYCEKENYEEQAQIEYVEVETIRYATEKEQIEHDKKEIEMIAKTVWGEAGFCSKTEQAAVVWCILNRVDDDRFPNNIIDVITQKNQFSGYSESHPVKPEIVELVNDVMTRWVFEKTAIGDVGRVLPKEYCWFRAGDGENVFRDAHKGNFNIWDWSLESPYKED